MANWQCQCGKMIESGSMCPNHCEQKASIVNLVRDAQTGGSMDRLGAGTFDTEYQEYGMGTATEVQRRKDKVLRKLDEAWDNCGLQYAEAMKRKRESRLMDLPELQDELDRIERMSKDQEKVSQMATIGYPQQIMVDPKWGKKQNRQQFEQRCWELFHARMAIQPAVADMESVLNATIIIVREFERKMKELQEKGE